LRGEPKKGNADSGEPTKERKGKEREDTLTEKLTCHEKTLGKEKEP